MLKEIEHSVQNTRIGNGFIPQSPIHIAIKRANVNYVIEDDFSSMNNVFDEMKGTIFGRSGKNLHFRIKIMNYYWLTTVKYCMDYEKRCQYCQYHANFNHQLPELLPPTLVSWLFMRWTYMYILVGSNYFKWIWKESTSFKYN